MNDFITYLTQLPLWQLIWSVLTFIVGISFSIRNYTLYTVSKLKGSSYNQNSVGVIIDWMWLTSVVVLVIMNI